MFYTYVGEGKLPNDPKDLPSAEEVDLLSPIYNFIDNYLRVYFIISVMFVISGII